MSEETETTETEKEAAPPVVQYAVHSMARSRHNRTQRAALPKKPSRRQFVGADQLRVAHGRPRLISEDYLRKNLAEFRQREKEHVLEVRTLDGRKLDLETLEPLAAAVAANTTPNFPLDSVANDKNFPGLNIPPQFGSDDTHVPVVLQEGEKPALFESAAETANAADEGNAPGDRETPIDDLAIDAAVEKAQEEAFEELEEPAPAPAAKEEVSSSEKKGGGSHKKRSGR